MKPKKIAYYLYFIACAVALVAIIVGDDLLLLLSKPMIIPSIYFYYLTKVKRIDGVFSLVMALSFIGDTVILLGLHDLLYIIVPYYLSYLLLLGYIVRDTFRLPVHWVNVMIGLLLAAGHALMLYLVLDLQTTEGRKFIVPFTIYGITLSLMVTLSVYNYLADRSIASFYMMIASICNLVSDVFYVLYNEHFHLPILNYINSAMQFFTYIFLVRYILNRRVAKPAIA